MHERKVEMAKRSSGFIGLPGGFGTFEEASSGRITPNYAVTAFFQILEVATWTQLGIHKKRLLAKISFLKRCSCELFLSLAVVVLNVLSFFDPLRQLIRNGISEGYIHASNADLIIFIDGPTSHEEHESFDWGTAAIQALESWAGNNIKALYDWTKGKDGKGFEQGSLGVV